MLAWAVVVITLALVFYSIGVWGERIQRTLQWWHVVFFALGLTCDTIGTLMMTAIAGERRASGVQASPLDTLMAWSGTAAILLMAAHLAWAIVVMLRGRATEKASFHRFSVVVWAIWLLPYIAGAAGAMLGD